MKAIPWPLFGREISIGLRRRGEFMNPLFFFMVVVSLFPLAISPDPNKLVGIASGILWICALLAALLSLESMFRQDYEDGMLDQFLLSSIPLPWFLLAKVLAHWLMTGLPLALFSPFMAVTLALPAEVIPVQILALMLGTLSLSFLGSVAAALSVGLRKGGMLVSILVMPLLVPVVIFGASATQSAYEGIDYVSPLLFLASFCMASALVAPLLAALGLRVSVADY